MSRRRDIIKIIVQIFALVLIFICAFFLARIAGQDEVVRNFVLNYGYWGILGVSFLSGFNLAVPIPAVAFVPLFVESGLNFYITIIIITFGVTIADSLAYFLGHSGGKIFSLIQNENKSSLFLKIQNLSQTKPIASIVLIFLFASVVPIPNEIILIPMGILGFNFFKILPALLLGNLAFNSLYSMGIIRLFEFI